MKLKDFIGKHSLTGCQNGSVPKKDEWQDSDPNTLDFILDGRLFSVIEDPSDGFRSSMDEIIENRPGLIVTNIFEPCEVIGVFRPDGSYEKNDVIDFYDVVTGKVVMSIGTENTDDYYPCFVGSFSPENMAANKDKE
jgi:hypothetical protein